jgi:galactose mutarotase-like enzyme
MTSKSGLGSAVGADRICMSNDSLAITILPAAGGNISELTDRRTGRNWLWQNPHIPITDNREGEDYGRDLDSGGWDEVLLSISPDRLDISNKDRRRIADHGDLVRQHWAAERINDQFGNDRCVMSVSGKALAFDFRRTITLHRDQPRLEFSYGLRNNENFSWPWYWTAHALLNALANMRIELPQGLAFHIDTESHDLDRARAWPVMRTEEQKSFDLSACFAISDKTHDFASKVFVRSPGSGRVDVAISDSSERLTMHFDPQEIPWLGLWINNRGWSGCGSDPYLNLGLEPATTPYDSVSQAIDNDAVIWLEPGESRQWSLAVELSA